jgi:hypothetical protein
VRYRIFLDILRISRNRKMAALQRAKVLQRRGLKRWQSNSLVSSAPCSAAHLFSSFIAPRALLFNQKSRARGCEFPRPT